MLFFIAINTDNTRRAVVCFSEQEAVHIFGIHFLRMERVDKQRRRADKAVWDMPGIEFIQLENPFHYWARADDREAILKDEALGRLFNKTKRNQKALEYVIAQRDRRRIQHPPLTTNPIAETDEEILKVVRKMPYRDTKEEFGTLDQEASIHRFFYPRELWSPEGTVRSPLNSEIITALVKFKHQGKLALRKELIERVECPFSRGPLNLRVERNNPLLWLALARRGNTEIKDQTWSAYQYVQALHPNKVFIARMENALYYYQDGANSLIATAGNMPPDRIFPIMIKQGITQLNIVHEGTIVRDGFEYESDDLVMITMTIAKDALTAVSEIFKSFELKLEKTLQRAQEAGQQSFLESQFRK